MKFSAGRRTRREQLALALLLLVLAGLLVWARVRSHRDIDAAEREQLTHQAAGLENILALQLANTRSALVAVRDSLPDWRAVDRPVQANRQFRTVASALSGVGDLQWIDADGRVVASDRDALIGIDRSGRSDFRSARDRPDPARLIVSPPLRTALGVYSIDVAVAVTGADGRFDGVITATLDPAYFSTVMASALYADGMRAVVVHGDGVALVYTPAEPSRQGANLAMPGSLFSRFLESGQASLVLDGVVLGSEERRLAAFRRLQPPALAMDRPLVLAVSRPQAQVFEPWELNTVAYAGLFGVCAVITCAFLLAFQRRRAQQEAHDAGLLSRKAADDERLELALHGADLALWDLHVPTGRVTVNARWHAMLGHTPEEVSPDAGGWEALIHPDDRAGALAARDEHLAGRARSFDATYRLRHRDGDWIWVVNRGRIVERDAQGRPTRMVGTNLDATQLVAAEAALRRSEQDLAITLQSIGDGVIATDTAGTVTRLNAAAETLTGWRAAEAVGAPLSRIFRIVDADSHAPADDPVARVLAGREVVALGDAMLLVARDGSERRIADSAAPIRDAEGAVVGVVLVFSDISQQHAAMQAIRDSEHQLTTLTAALPGPVARFDRQGRYLFTNATCERWFGESAAARLGRDWRDVFPASIVAALDPPMRRSLDGFASTFDATLPTLQGDRQAMVSIVPDRAPDGSVQGCIVALTDVTDRKRAEEALRQSEERSRSLLRALRSGVVVHAADTTIVDANPSACRILGRSREALLGLRGDDPLWCHLEEDGTEMPAASIPVRQVQADGEPVNARTVGVRWRGAPEPAVWLLCSAFAVRDPGGAVQQIVVTFVDVTEHKVAQERLARSEEQLRMASRLARLGGWRFDVATARITLAPELVELIGAGPDALADDGFASAMAPADRTRWNVRLRRAIDDGLPIDEEFVAAGAHGRTAHWRILGEAVRDAAGAMAAVQGAVQDVTDAREAQQQLRLLEAAVAGLNDAVLITDAESHDDEPGPRTVFVNAAFERMSGFDRAAAIGRSPRMMQGPLTAGPELDRLREATQQQRPAHVELVNYRRDGSPYWVEVSMVPLVDGHGRTTHYVAVQREITERKQAAAAIEAAQRELAATLAAVPDLLFDVDLEGYVHQCHAPANGRLPADAAAYVGRRIDEVFPAEAAAVVRAALREAQAEGHSAGLQYELASRSGERWFELSVAGKPTADGEPPRFILLARDVSERQELEAQRRMLERQLREAQKMESIGTLAGGIAHDFNNILAAILGNLALARDELPGDHAAHATLNQIGKAAVRARSLVHQILTFSRRQPNPLRPRALRPVIDETIGLLRATLPAAVRLESRLAERELVVSADATQLQQVLMNLCTNAWQSLREGRGRIEIGLEALDADARIADLAGEGPHAHLWVSDDGAGMDALTRERIFDPFFTTKPVGEGTGLGLSVVHGIVRSHRGAIAVETAVGEGSTFHLYFPLVEGAAGRELDSGHAPLALPARPANGADGRGGHLLYVDDDEVMVLMVERLLQREGYRVTGCASGAEALDRLGEPDLHVDLVVSDFNMPEMSGLEFAERLARVRPLLPIVISSGYVTDELRSEAQALGVRALLQKEHTLEELPGLVRQVLAGAMRL